jgi:uncharacterized protein
VGIPVEIQKIPSEGMKLKGFLPSEELSLDCEGVAPSGPLEYDLAVEMASRELIVRGRLKLPLELVCSRCVKTFGHEIRVPRYVFTRTVAEREIIDLTESVREDIIIALPLKPLCRDACKGLCPRCGRDRNLERCSCPPPRGDVRWSALEGLELPPERER